MTETITITLCDRAENHVGMQKIGNYAECGFSLEDLIKTRDWFIQKGGDAIIYDLNYPLINNNIYPDDEAYILIIKKGIDYILKNNNANELFTELKSLNWDTKAYMYGRVVNKIARHNICFGDNNQKPDYQAGKGRIIAFNKVPLLKAVKNKLSKILGPIGEYLVAEGNYYYNVNKCGIGFHGDSERKKVIGIRLGASMSLVYQWYSPIDHQKQKKRIGESMVFQLDHGDLYFMSIKATGNDWKMKKIYTLRHAAGSDKYVI